MGKTSFISTSADGWAKLIANGMPLVLADGVSLDEAPRAGDTIEVMTADGPAHVVITPALRSAMVRRPG